MHQSASDETCRWNRFFFASLPQLSSLSALLGPAVSWSLVPFPSYLGSLLSLPSLHNLQLHGQERRLLDPLISHLWPVLRLNLSPRQRSARQLPLWVDCCWVRSAIVWLPVHVGYEVQFTLLEHFLIRGWGCCLITHRVMYVDAYYRQSHRRKCWLFSKFVASVFLLVLRLLFKRRNHFIVRLFKGTFCFIVASRLIFCWLFRSLIFSLRHIYEKEGSSITKLSFFFSFFF